MLITTPTHVTRSASRVSRTFPSLLFRFLSAYKTLDLEVVVVVVFDNSLLVPLDDNDDGDDECFAMADPNPWSLCQYRTRFRRNVSVDDKATMLIATVIQSAR
jgi:hypothetical protein